MEPFCSLYLSSCGEHYELLSHQFYNTRRSSKYSDFAYCVEIEFFMINVVSPRDFVAVHHAYSSSDYAMKKTVSLYCLTKDCAFLVETDDGVDVTKSSTSPFQYIGQFKHAKYLIKIPNTAFIALAEKIGDPKFHVCFMPNTGRCGSTLLAQALEKVPGTLLHAEPDSLTNLGFLWKEHSLSQSKYEKLLHTLIRYLCKPQEGIQRVVIKTRSCATCHVSTCGKYFPKQTIVFGYRNSLKTVSSFLGLMISETALSITMYFIDSDTFSGLVPWLRRRMHYYFCYMLERNHPREEVKTLNTVEQFTYAWANCVKCIQVYQEEKGKVNPISYETIVLDKVKTLKDIFEILNIDEKYIGEALKAFENDSQAGSPLERDNIRNLDRRRVTDADKVKGNKILQRFGLPELGTELKL